MIHSHLSVQLCAPGCTDLVPSVDGELEELRLREQTCTHRTTESSRRVAARSKSGQLPVTTNHALSRETSVESAEHGTYCSWFSVASPSWSWYRIHNWIADVLDEFQVLQALYTIGAYIGTQHFLVVKFQTDLPLTSKKTSVLLWSGPGIRNLRIFGNECTTPQHEK